jgi:hypothetical protein
MNAHPNVSTGAALIAGFAIFFWAQADDAQRIGNPPSAAQHAAQVEARAIARRGWAEQQACSNQATAEWQDDQTMRCLRNVDQPTLIAGGRQ